jgi:hypothetical protein
LPAIAGFVSTKIPCHSGDNENFVNDASVVARQSAM